MKVTWNIKFILLSTVKYTALMSSFKGNDKSLIKLFLDSNPGGQYINIFTYIIWNKLPFMNSLFLSIFLTDQMYMVYLFNNK